jgi:L-alanine-DL-glutamate epimerase-like enolase superfamily enzyme
VPIKSLEVSAYTIPTEAPESDGTYEWSSTTLVLAEAEAGDTRSLGFSYADLATATLINGHLKHVVEGRDCMDINGCWHAMVDSIRNIGRPGVASMAISAVDNALWDLKARLLGLPLVSLLGAVRPAVPIYGSGGFTSYSTEQLQEQLGHWSSQGMRWVKMKIGREHGHDLARVRAARQAIEPHTELYVDANGAYPAKHALKLAREFVGHGVTWFEEPVTSDDLEGLRLLRERGPEGMEIAAGEYGYTPGYFLRMLGAGAVDVLQADVTRCGGITGFLKAGALSESFLIPLSAHCAPALHVALGCALSPMRHLEYFHDHVRIEQLLFEGNQKPKAGMLAPDFSRPGFGLEFKRADAERFRAI